MLSQKLRDHLSLNAPLLYPSSKSSESRRRMSISRGRDGKTQSGRLSRGRRFERVSGSIPAHGSGEMERMAVGFTMDPFGIVWIWVWLSVSRVCLRETGIDENDCFGDWRKVATKIQSWCLPIAGQIEFCARSSSRRQVSDMRSPFQSTSSHSLMPDRRRALPGPAMAPGTPHSRLERENIKFTDLNGAGTADDAVGSHGVIHLLPFPVPIYLNPLSPLCR
jgi:hypothetical protein